MLKIIKEKIKNNTYLFIIIKNISAYTIYFLNRVSNYRLKKIRFYKILGYKLNLKNPQSYNEKIFWKKIHDRNPLLPITADKYLVRSYIKEVLEEETANKILIPLLYVTDKPETIPFEKLPADFVVKPNHASGRYIIVKNGSYDKKEIIKTCRRWLKIPYGLDKLEWAYQPIKRKIVIEKLLQDEDGKIPKRYSLQMFQGRCKWVQAIIVNKLNNISITTFDDKWNLFSVKIPNYPQEPENKKPENYEIMLKIAEKLCKPFDFVRADLYNISGKTYFGELTHYPASGIGRFDPQSFDYELGKYWNIKPKYWEKLIKNHSHQ